MIYVALHYVTESADHYNSLISAWDIDGLVKACIEEMKESLEYTCNFWVSGECWSTTKIIRNAIGEAIDKAKEDTCLD